MRGQTENVKTHIPQEQTQKGIYRIEDFMSYYTWKRRTLARVHTYPEQIGNRTTLGLTEARNKKNENVMTHIQQVQSQKGSCQVGAIMSYDTRKRRKSARLHTNPEQIGNRPTLGLS